MMEIDAKTEKNLAMLKRSKIPEYQQEIQSMSIREDITDELDWKIEELRQQRASVESEINVQHSEFEKVKTEERKKYDALKHVYSENAKKEKGIDAQIAEIDARFQAILQESRNAVNEAQQKIEAVEKHIDQISHSGSAKLA